ncbi:MAG: hypothetical protein JWP36_103 [Paucimonas sp.]|jgi:hypothetical protein|nr:hypothetical protein [Paucimonas sp.]
MLRFYTSGRIEGPNRNVLIYANMMAMCFHTLDRLQFFGRAPWMER